MCVSEYRGLGVCASMHACTSALNFWSTSRFKDFLPYFLSLRHIKNMHIYLYENKLHWRIPMECLYCSQLRSWYPSMFIQARILLFFSTISVHHHLSHSLTQWYMRKLGGYSQCVWPGNVWWETTGLDPALLGCQVVPGIKFRAVCLLDYQWY